MNDHPPTSATRFVIARARHKRTASAITALLAVVALAAIPAFGYEKPVYLAPLTHISPDIAAGPPALQLIGITLLQSATPVTGTPPEIYAADPLVLRAYWKPSVQMSSTLPFEVQFWDHLCLLSVVREFRAGPRLGETPWLAGSVYPQEYTLDAAEIAASFTGNGHLIVSLKSSPGSRGTSLPVQLLDIRVRARFSPRPLSSAALERELPGADRVLAQYVRLNFGAAATLEVPTEWRTGNRRMALVSSLSYRTVPQGQPVCDIVVNAGDPTQATLPVLSGIVTSRCDYDVFAPGSLDHERARIFESRDSGTLGFEGRPVQLHTFIGIIDLPQHIEQIASLRFECNAEVVLDVYGVILLP